METHEKYQLLEIIKELKHVYKDGLLLYRVITELENMTKMETTEEHYY